MVAYEVVNETAVAGVVRKAFDSRVYRLRFAPWNPEKASRPFAGLIVALAAGGVAELAFGPFAGSASEGGVVVVRACEGDVIAWGSVAFLGSARSFAWGAGKAGRTKFALVGPGGVLEAVSASAARRHYASRGSAFRFAQCGGQA